MAVTRSRLLYGAQNFKADGDQNFVGVGGVHKAEVRGNGGKIDGGQNFVGAEGLQSSARTGLRGHGGLIGNN